MLAITDRQGQHGLSGLMDDVLVRDIGWDGVQHDQGFNDVEPGLRYEVTRNLELFGYELQSFHVAWLAASTSRTMP